MLNSVFVAFNYRSEASDLSFTQEVNPFIGTTNNGNVFPGADYPYGMIQWSPDTDKMTQSGGYRYEDTTIQGFSLTHFSGRYFRCYEDFPIMPTIGPISVSPGSNWHNYDSTFSHANEAASPGYYGVKLDKNNIQEDLTVTRRTGLGRFIFPASTNATLLINAGGSASGNVGTGTSIQITGSDTLTGSTEDKACGRGPGYRIYFAAQFDQPFSAHGTWQGATLTPNAESATGSHTGAYLVFDTTASAAVLVKVAISYVSIENARLNLTTEATTWDFTTARNNARNVWNAKLNAIQVTGGTGNQRTVFYTALYHTMIHPNVTSDVNGDYIGFDGQRHTMPSGHAYYQNQTSWDNYRTLIPLNAIISPQETADMVQSLILMAQQDQAVNPAGGGLPRWVMIGGGSDSMHGDGQDIAIASAYAFGVTDFAAETALAIMDRGASIPGTTASTIVVREDLTDYLSKGYVPEPNGGGAASLTLELASDDFAIAQFAKALGDSTKYNRYLRRAQNWKNLWDRSATGNGFTGYIVPRGNDGHFIPGFDPANNIGFREATSAQITWMIPFNERALIARMGGDAMAIARLDFHLSRLNTGIKSVYAYMGNEPASEVPYIYTFAGVPYKTQSTIRRIIDQLYTNTPGGIPGNDDGGAMASWTVLSMLGLYPMTPGVAGFVLSSPFFPAETIHIAGGHAISINAPQTADTSPYIQAVNLNGSPYPSSWLPWNLVSAGATLDFTLSSAPAVSWANAMGNRPPSFDLGDDYF